MHYLKTMMMALMMCFSIGLFSQVNMTTCSGFIHTENGYRYNVPFGSTVKVDTSKIYNTDFFKVTFSTDSLYWVDDDFNKCLVKTKDTTITGLMCWTFINELFFDADKYCISLYNYQQDFKCQKSFCCRTCSDLCLKYPESIAEKIYNHEVWVGMSEQMLYESIGYPKKEHTFVSSDVKSKQLTYNNLYVYISNGVVVSYSKIK